MKRLLVSFYPGDERAKDIVVIQDFKDNGVFKVINAFEGDEAKKIIDMLTDKDSDLLPRIVVAGSKGTRLIFSLRAIRRRRNLACSIWM